MTLAEAPKRSDARLRQPRLQLRQGDVGHLDKKSADEIAVLLGPPRQPIAASRLGTRIATRTAQRLPPDPLDTLIQNRAAA
ncbi:hypothetical protein [Methylocapsa aurea]|uniref:hypothetical protein n=1 Tax=Methylocapsa aurea TaxID=663610 RepID=UPI000568DF33|nr:hypothetical protein [Methylocapsa aurea]